MNKTLIIARKEFIDTVVNLINTSDLPAFVIADILKACLVEVNALAEQQYQKEIEQYEKENGDGRNSNNS